VIINLIVGWVARFCAAACLLTALPYDALAQSIVPSVVDTCYVSDCGLAKDTYKRTTEVLGAAGLRVGEVTTVSSSLVAAGKVASQFPTPGQRLPQGSMVNIVIASDSQCGNTLSEIVGPNNARVAAKSNGSKTTTKYDCGDYQFPTLTSSYGDTYQCIEFVRRYYSTAMGVATSAWPKGDADKFYYESRRFSGLVLHKNYGEPALAPGFIGPRDPRAGSVRPAVNDILVFDTIAPAAQSVGHVAIVKQVTETTITVIEQNWSKRGAERVLEMVSRGAGYVDVRPQVDSQYQVLGWLRKSSPSFITYSYTGNYFDRFDRSISYSASDRVTARLTLASPLPAGATLLNVRSFPGFSLSMNDGHQTMVMTSSSPGEVLVSTDGSGNLIGPWSVFINCCLNPNNNIFTLNYPGVRGVGDGGYLSAPNGSFPSTPFDGGQVFSNPGRWMRE
jgi:surface antigen